MRTITLIIIHCSATPEGKSLSAEALTGSHPTSGDSVILVIISTSHVMEKYIQDDR